MLGDTVIKLTIHVCIRVLRQDSSRCQPEWPKGMLAKSRQMWVLKVKCENIKDSFWDFYHGDKGLYGRRLTESQSATFGNTKITLSSVCQTVNPA